MSSKPRIAFHPIHTTSSPSHAQYITTTASFTTHVCFVCQRFSGVQYEPTTLRYTNPHDTTLLLCFIFFSIWAGKIPMFADHSEDRSIGDDMVAINGTFGTARCLCCGRPVANKQRHKFVATLRLSGEERSCLIGRAGLTIQELVRRCRVCICIERKRVVIASGDAHLTNHAVDMVRGRVANALRERLEPRSYLLRRGWYDPEDVLASRPSGCWRLERGRLVAESPRHVTPAVRVVPRTSTEEPSQLPIAQVRRRSSTNKINLSWRSIAAAR